MIGAEKPKKWEDGLNRIANISEITTFDECGIPYILDKWNTFEVKFQIFHPFIYDESDRIQISVNNDEPIDMSLLNRDLSSNENWLVEKYGSDKFVTPFEIDYEFHVRNFDDK